ncbi:MAG: hypothetical protein OXO52_11495 [Rhodospirillales bacterium]|nr:hypothetical protein [Rhodospirillales bacterium]MDE0382158.1 hypothetical protein [Rhodospirillales bacterium]
MPCRHPALTIALDRVDSSPLPGPTDRARMASRSTRRSGAARPRRGTLSIDRSTGITPRPHEPSHPPRYELVGLYPDCPDIETEQVFSVHHDESAAWSAFHEALLHTDARVVLLRHRNPAGTVLASSEHPPYSAIYDAATRAQAWS